MQQKGNIYNLVPNMYVQQKQLNTAFKNGRLEKIAVM